MFVDNVPRVEYKIIIDNDIKNENLELHSYE